MTYSRQELYTVILIYDNCFLYIHFFAECMKYITNFLPQTVFEVHTKFEYIFLNKSCVVKCDCSRHFLGLLYIQGL